MMDENIPIAKIAGLLNCNRKTLYNYVNHLKDEDKNIEYPEDRLSDMKNLIETI